MFVFSNLAISVDGKIATAGREHFPLGTPADRRQMQVLRKRADAILMGASTLRAWKGPLTVRGARVQPLNVVVSHALEGVSPAWKFFRETSTRRLIFVSSSAKASRLKRFERSSELVALPARGPSAPFILRELERRGITRLLVEGGGGVMWDFVERDLLDEVHVTVTPRLLGGTAAPTLVDGAGFSPRDVVNLRLKRVRRLGDELYLVYSRTGRRGP
jgi:5-amino-6-(5-phosphoribosylamino)uracil reductase